MFLIRNILKGQGMKFSQVFAFQYRCFRTSAYLTSSPNSKKLIETYKYQQFKLAQARAQKNSQCPTYMKFSPWDRRLYYITICYMLFVGFHVFKMLYDLKCIS